MNILGWTNMQVDIQYMYTIHAGKIKYTHRHMYV